ncbi:MAG: sulfurtransferase [Pseudomonadota bacterium]
MQAWSTLVKPSELIASDGLSSSVVFDCRFDLTDPNRGLASYREQHVPGAHYADLNSDLSSPPGDGGRHPLPEPDAFARWIGDHGVSDDTQVVAYDDGVGAFAARLWWLLRWMGHEKAAVLDGGLKAWAAAGGELDSGEVQAPVAASFRRRPSRFATRSLQDVEAASAAGDACLVDARDRARFLGEHEPFAPVAGHIPSARSRPFQSNCDASGEFKTASALQNEFAQYGPGDKIFYCGSGVTACHNILAAVHAGLLPPALFVGSWSQWVLDSARPVATGDEGPR